ncbi:uncharacterized protein PSFLO_01716 [Pseudozyma flocculosa]|uniref:Uncharacterized protein n=1 Tax=Pseudozyma flocculosa TaxID=84751 RepID=A0A5C3EWT7_9BASI|nr:uncharacterized protein PSFLO_01716 [Pseudozyma flocculosa]
MCARCAAARALQPGQQRPTTPSRSAMTRPTEPVAKIDTVGLALSLDRRLNPRMAFLGRTMRAPQCSVSARATLRSCRCELRQRAREKPGAIHLKGAWSPASPEPLVGLLATAVPRRELADRSTFERRAKAGRGVGQTPHQTRICVGKASGWKARARCPAKSPALPVALFHAAVLGPGLPAGHSQAAPSQLAARRPVIVEEARRQRRRQQQQQQRGSTTPSS